MCVYVNVSMLTETSFMQYGPPPGRPAASEPVVIDTIVKWVLKKVLSINANFFSGDN